MSGSGLRPWRWVASAASLAAALLSPAVALAGSPFLEVGAAEEAVSSPAYRYANMTNEEAFAELDRRALPYSRVDPVSGVRAPIRLAGPLHGVDLHSALPAAQRAASMFEILDARLALALDDFCVILAQHDVVEVVHYTMYRPNVPAPGSAAATAASDKRKSNGVKDAKALEDVKQVASKEAPRAPDVDPPKKSAARAKVKPRPSKRRADAGSPGSGKSPGGKSLDGKGTKALKTGRRSAAGGASRKQGLEREELADVVPASDAAKAPAGRAPAAAKDVKPTKKKGGGAPSRAARSGSKLVAPKSNERPHGKWAPPGTRHPAGLAFDLGFMKKRDGSLLHVASHFDGAIGAATCGPTASRPAGEEAQELRDIVCEARASGIFTYALTPNYDAAHVDHFHLEIKPGVKWFLYH